MAKKICILLLFLACSCSYRLRSPGNLSVRTVNVPYITGDREGVLTQSIIYQLSSDGFLEYRPSHADCELKVEILEKKNDQIGYRRDRDGDTVKKNLMPTESRQTIKAKVSLESSDHDIIWGPTIITADVDYDYVEQDSLEDLSFLNPKGELESVLSFSLGQMESVGSAQISALKPLYSKLARNIAEALKGELGEKNY